MKTYPHATPDGIIELVEKSQYDAVVSELEQEVRDNTDLRQRSHEKSVEITNLRADLSRYSAEREHNAMQALMWQSMAERLATAAQGYDTTAVEYREWQHAMRAALAAYESAAKGEQP